MSARPVRSTLLAALLALSAGCGEKEVTPSLDLVSASCAGTPPLMGVTHLRFRVSGPGLDTPRERVSTVRWTPADVPAIPPGSARVLEVRAYAGAPDQGGQLRSLGRTAPFDVVEGQAASARVFLRRLGEFAPVNQAASPDTCAVPGETRAGHTATLLADGRVLFAGGYAPGRDGTRPVSGTTEVFDPVAGTFSPGPDVGARAFHTASPLPDGRVLLVGGAETLDQVSLQRTARVVDVAEGVASTLEPKVARYQHAAAVDADGHVLLVGGRAADGSGAFALEGFDAASGRFFDGMGELHRVDATLTVLEDGHTILVAGGSDALRLEAEVLSAGFDGDTFGWLLPVPPRLRVPRVGASVAMLGRAEDGPRPLLMGGFDGVDPLNGARAVGASEVLESPIRVSDGPALLPRSNACAVSLQDGRVVVVGGRGADSGIARATAWAELIIPAKDAQPSVLGLSLLPQPRVWHTCTALADGSVLVVGGVDDSTGEPRAPIEALVVMPPPRD
ncbi:hypothetical protein D7X74_06950 [Corallococcus sp. CA047B]|uniref:kelch repeat-containing protein n=1 Tax=Corallococcus sp. CA047B TaxID=2316729 RepID=UPI000EA0C650|nr:kelch repeat-containing protein [Corallococcus sp. CA047B]RKH19376.1 hypothetical protein D7X74_06950 [Corallococcus sp. CA047B]